MFFIRSSLTHLHGSSLLDHVCYQLPRFPVGDHAHDLLLSLSGLLINVDFVPLCTLFQFVTLLLVLDGNFWVLIETPPVRVILFEMTGD